MDKTILVVDDEEEICWTLERILSKAGYKTLTAASAMQGLVLLQDNPVHLLITDIRMPGISGLDLIKQTRDLDPQIPIIAISGFGSVETAMESLERGAFFFLNKPFDSGAIMDIVEKGMRLSGLADGSASPLENTRHTISFSLAPRTELAASAIRHVANAAMMMGYPPRYHGVIIPFIFDEMLVRAQSRARAQSSGEDIQAKAVIDGDRIEMTFKTLPGAYDPADSGRAISDADLGDPSAVGIMITNHYAGRVIFSGDGSEAKVVIRNTGA